MKKLLLAVSLLAGMSVSAVELNVNDATDIEGTYVAEKPAEGDNNGEAAKYQPLQSLKIAGYSFSFTDGGHSSKPAYYYNMSTSDKTQNTIRIYGNDKNQSTVTITAPEGVTFSAIKMTGTNGTANGTVNATEGTAAMPSKTEVNWGNTTPVSTVTLTFFKNFRIETITVTEGEGGETPTPPTPPVVDENTIYESDFATSNSDCTFEDGTLPEGLSFVWTRNTKDNYFYMKASGYYKKAYAVEGAYLVSPVLDLTQRNEIVLTFNHAYGYVGSLEEAQGAYSLWVREEGGQWADELTISQWPEFVAGKFSKFGEAGEISLDAYKDKKIQLGWKYTSTAENAGTWEIDRVKVTGKKAQDAIENVDFDANAPVEYFNLQGVRVANPEGGMFIMRQGNKVTKVIR